MAFTPTAQSIITQVTVSGDFVLTEQIGENGGVLGITEDGYVPLVQPDIIDGGVIQRIVPRPPDGGKAANLPFNFTCNQTDNAPNLTNNFIVGMGHNLAAGGGRESTEECAIGILIEQRYDAGDLEAGGLPIAEMHFVYVARDTANNLSAGQQIRLRSYTINKELNTVDLYDTANKHYIKLPSHYYYQTEYGDETDAIWWSMQPGEFILKNGIHGTQQISLSCNLTYDVPNSLGRATFACDAVRLTGDAVEFVATHIRAAGEVSVESGDLTLASSARLVSNNSTNLAIYLAAGSAFAEGAWRSRTGLEVYIPNTPPVSGNESCYVTAVSVGGVAYPAVSAGGVGYGLPLRVAAPASASSTGVAGTIAYDSNYFYQCVATDTWKRTALSTW